MRRMIIVVLTVLSLCAGYGVGQVISAYRSDPPTKIKPKATPSVALPFASWDA